MTVSQCCQIIAVLLLITLKSQAQSPPPMLEDFWNGDAEWVVNIFDGLPEYGDVNLSGADAHPYFDFRYVSSAEVTKIGDHYYMFYEGIRGSEELEIGSDTQFGLGLARPLGDSIDGEWETFEHNPIIMDMQFNWGIGHADFIIIDGVSYLYTSTSIDTRGRYELVWQE